MLALGVVVQKVIRVECFIIDDVRNVVMMKVLLPIRFFMVLRFQCSRLFIWYLELHQKKGMSTIELGTEVRIQQKTSWLFKRKVQAVMNRDKNDKLNGEVHIDETLIGCFSCAV